MSLAPLKMKRLALSAGVALAFAVSAPAFADESVPQNDLLNATLWMQKSVEYKGNVLGTFALARIRLDEALADKSWTALPEMQDAAKVSDMPTAIILDCDETILDNNLYEAHLVKDGTDFSPKEWTAYVNSEQTTAMPGAVEFTQYAASKGVKVFYITNRTKEEESATATNMEKLGFPMGGNVDTLLTKGEKEEWGSPKGSRDQLVAKDYRVLLMLGDNFSDFTDDYKGTLEERQAVFEKAQSHWGKDWLVLPNPEYGSFESAPFLSDYKLSADERRKKKIDALDGWTPKN
ncbi:5'-nucleotidase, lipoprotein e(P4) family [Rhizobium halophytocola]|uniref:Acid phosphatase n=1 Tax=Rhizobium halophytocola TaxID=735519 RepID=A0ABS4DXT9_9HYPH|nr:HAD family acid phosphatase [Rhizobium halophytocola]MBP1850508.1 acid phosphatase [Rhizobium halophytocola]